MRVVLVFLRLPEPGRAKTRLIPLLGAEGACRVYRRMVEHLAGVLRNLPEPRPHCRYLFAPATGLVGARDWLGDDLELHPQVEGDLGARLQAGFADAFAGGASAVLAIGTDCLDIDAALLELAYQTLQRTDAVLAPASDGGYTLIGLARPLPQAFDAIPWSSPQTCAITLERLAAAGAEWQLLAEMQDIDTPEDLRAARARWPRVLRG